MTAIDKTSRVTLHFSLSLAGGEVIDSNFDSAPATFSMGDGSLLPAFEDELVGMKVGETKEALIQAELAFGLGDSRNIQRFPRKQFANLGKESDEAGKALLIEPGLVLSFSVLLQFFVRVGPNKFDRWVFVYGFFVFTKRWFGQFQSVS